MCCCEDDIVMKNELNYNSLLHNPHLPCCLTSVCCLFVYDLMVRYVAYIVYFVNVQDDGRGRKDVLGGAPSI